MDQQTIDLIRRAVELEAQLIGMACELQGFFGDVYFEHILTSIFGFTWTRDDVTSFTDAEICEWFADMQRRSAKVPGA